MRRAHAKHMKTQTIDTEQIKENINLIDLAGRFVELNRETPTEFSAPCPKCGGSDRFHVTEAWFFCRQCHPNRGDAIEFVRWLNGIAFVDACAQLAQGTFSAMPAAPMAPSPKQPAIGNEWNEDRQRQQAMRAHNELIAQKTDCARMAMEYMNGRGINSETLTAFRIGCRMTSLPATWDPKAKGFTYPRQVAVSLPWLNHDVALVSVKYRFVASHTYSDINQKKRTENKTSKGQSSGHVFGWQALRGPAHVDTLVICEGEINALSLWQVGHDRIDVLSTGTESTMQHLPPVVADLAARYKRVIVWADRGTIADSAARAINAASMRSPITDSYPNGMDANDLLKVGKLSEMIDWMMKRLQSPQAVKAAPTVGDLTGYVGGTVDNAMWAALKTECTRRYGDLWRFEARPRGDGWYIERLNVRPEEEPKFEKEL